MKRIKQILAIFITLLIVAMMCILPVSADTVATVTLQNTNTAVTMLGHTYKAYKIFDVSFNNDKSSYNYTVDTDFAALTGADYDTVSAYNTDELFAFAKTVFTFITTNNITQDAILRVTSSNLTDDGTTQSVEFPFSEYGYYLIYDKYDYADAYDVVSALLLTTVDSNKTVNIKSDMPAVNKVITGVGSNSTTPVATTQTNAVDATIGDHVWFKLGSAVPDTIGYQSYVFQFHDTLSSGLTYDNNAVVYYDNTALSADSDYMLTYNENDRELTVEINSDVIMNGTKGKDIKVVYSAMLNSNAVVYNASNTNSYNTNTVYLTYSNNPSKSSSLASSSTGNTPEVEVRVYTFKMNIFKFTGSGSNKTGLADAVFSLKDSSGNYIAVTLDSGYTSGKYTVDPNTAASAANALVTSDNNGNISISGLESGTYTLTEETAPNGYAKLANPLSVPITVTYDTDGGVASYTNSTVEVENVKKLALPGTGGMGAALFIGIGITLMGIAITVFVIIRCKKSGKAD